MEMQEIISCYESCCKKICTAYEIKITRKLHLFVCFLNAVNFLLDLYDIRGASETQSVTVTSGKLLTFKNFLKKIFKNLQ